MACYLVKELGLLRKDLQEVVGELSSELERTLRGVRTIRAFYRKMFLLKE